MIRPPAATQVTVCFGDRPLGWNPPGTGPGCGLVNNSGSPCMAPTQVVFRSTDEGLVWRCQSPWAVDGHSDAAQCMFVIRGSRYKMY